MRALTLAFALLASLAALAPGLAAGGAMPGDDDAGLPGLPARAGDGWPDRERQAFLALCRQAGSEPFCHCVLGAVEPRFGSANDFYRELTRSGGRQRAAIDLDLARCQQRHGDDS